jgi:hypothetical protein
VAPWADPIKKMKSLTKKFIFIAIGVAILAAGDCKQKHRLAAGFCEFNSVHSLACHPISKV